jgi:hypothetical protein
MMIRFLPLTIAAIACSASAPVSAQSHNSLALSWGETLCPGYVQFSTDNGDSIVRWGDGPIPRAGIELEGDFETLGVRTVRGLDNKPVRIEVVASRLTMAQIHDYYRRCGIGRPARPTQR